MAAAGGWGDLIRAVQRLQSSIDRMDSAKKDISVNISLTDKIQAASSSGARVKVLSDISRSGILGPQAQQQVGEGLRTHRQSRTAYESLRRSRDRLQSRIDNLQKRWNTMPMHGSAAQIGRRSQALVDRIQAATQVKLGVERRMHAMRGRGARALGQASRAAQGGLSAGERTARLGAAMARLNVVVTSATIAWKAATSVVQKGYENLAHYGGYSSGGARAQVIEQIGNFFRNVRISASTSESMIKFAKASQQFQNSWEDLTKTVVVMNNRMAAHALELGAKLPGAVKSLWDKLPDWMKRLSIPGAGGAMPPKGGALAGGLGGQGPFGLGALAAGAMAAAAPGLDPAAFGLMQMAGLGPRGQNLPMRLRGPGMGMRRRVKGQVERMAEWARQQAAARAAADKAAGIARPNAAQKLRQQQDRRARAAKVAAVERQRFWGRRQEEELITGHARRQVASIREMKRAAGALTNRGRHRPLTPGEEDELHGLRQRIGVLQADVANAERRLREQFGAHKDLGDAATTGRDRQIFMNPLNLMPGGGIFFPGMAP